METTSVASQLRLAIARTNRRMRQEGGGGLPQAQHTALVSVERFGPLTPSELAAHERIQRPSATRVLAKLEEAGLVERTADPNDKRSALIAITPAGKDLLLQIRHAKDVYLEHRLETLNPAELATLQEAAQILERMLENE
jgi:DNA-binding MarR family transcriptional regulator